MGFERVEVKAGGKKKVKFIVSPGQMALINEKGDMVFEPGEFEVSVGGIQPGYEETVKGYTGLLKTTFEMV